MIRKISDISRKHPFACLFRSCLHLNFYIQAMSWRINHISDPMARQFNQNIFICLMGAVVAIGAVVLSLSARRPARPSTLKI